MSWKVQIAGPKTDLDDLCAVFTSDALRLERRGDSYFLFSARFDPLTDHHEVQAVATELIGMLSGASRLSLGSRGVLRFSCVISIDENGAETSYMRLASALEMTARPAVRVLHLDGTTTVRLPASLAPNWMDVAYSTPQVAKALRLFGTCGESWVDLYRILEVISQDVRGERSLVERGWVTSNALARFNHTANSAAAAGDAARHGADRFDPPTNPMTLGEAKALASVILHAWLQEKVCGNGAV